MPFDFPSGITSHRPQTGQASASAVKWPTPTDRSIQNGKAWAGFADPSSGALRKQASAIEVDTRRFYELAAARAQDASIRQLLDDLAREERTNEDPAQELTEENLRPDVKEDEDKARQHLFVLQILQPGLAGLMTGSNRDASCRGLFGQSRHRLNCSAPRIAAGAVVHLWGLTRTQLLIWSTTEWRILESQFECIAGMARVERATFALSDLGGETRIGRSMDTAMMPAITCRPLV